MNKKEQAAMEALRLERDMHAAMWIGEPVEPDVPAPEFGVTKGWRAFLHLNAPRAEPAVSSSVSHRFGDNAWDPCASHWSKGSVALHSTKARALRAARYLAAQQFAYNLAQCDRHIAELERDPNTGAGAALAAKAGA